MLARLQLYFIQTEYLDYKNYHHQHHFIYTHTMQVKFEEDSSPLIIIIKY